MATYSSYKGRPICAQMKNKINRVLSQDKKMKKVAHKQGKTPFWQNIKQHKR